MFQGITLLTLMQMFYIHASKPFVYQTVQETCRLQHLIVKCHYQHPTRGSLQLNVVFHSLGEKNHLYRIRYIWNVNCPD